jgi:hypothetical protein
MVLATGTPSGTEPVRPRHEVADIFRRYGPEYRRTHRLPPHHRRVMRDLERCRTAALGGHVDECDQCGTVRIAYNSCRNRHCPKCQGTARARWVAQQQAALLPIEYFHVVFTLPEALHPLLRAHPRPLLGLLFRTVAATLLEFGQRHLHGELGITAVLHTWGQTLVEHPHLHCLVTGGALARDGRRFVRCRSGYLFPVRALAQVFRGKYLAALQQTHERGELTTTGASGSDPAAFDQLLRTLQQQPWVVYAKRPFAGPEQVVGYIGRYTHRVAITNYRLLGLEDGRVRFTWKDYRDGGRQKVLTLAVMEFIRRFLLHVLPPGLVRIRHYGLLANGRRAKLTRCRELLAAPDGAAVIEAGGAPLPCAPSEARCPECGSGRLLRRLELLPYREEDPLAAANRARMNPHRPQPTTPGFVQQSVAADTPAALARSDG